MRALSRTPMPLCRVGDIGTEAERRGAFEHVVFAILDPLGTGNLGPFKRDFAG